VSAPRPDQHILGELGLSVTPAGPGLAGSMTIIPEMCVPDAPHLRTSILAASADHIAGLLAASVTAPMVPVTLELDVHLYAPAPGSGSLQSVSNTLKAGRSVFMARVEFSTGDGVPVAISTASFMTAPDTSLRLPSTLSIDGPARTRSLRVPWAQRAGCERREPGVAVLPRSDDGLNSSNTVFGGLIALAVEESLLSLSPGTTVSSLSLRYLRPLRVGPAVATARVRSGLGQVDVRDAGNENRLTVLGTARLFDR